MRHIGKNRISSSFALLIALAVLAFGGYVQAADETPSGTDGKTAETEQALPPGIKVFSHEAGLFTLESENASLPDVMKLLSAASGVEIDVMEGVEGKATAGVKGVDLETVIRRLLHASGEENWALTYSSGTGEEDGSGRLVKVTILPKARREGVKARPDYKPPRYENELGYEAFEVPLSQKYVTFKGPDGEVFKKFDIKELATHELRSLEDIEKLEGIFLDPEREKNILMGSVKYYQLPIEFSVRKSSGSNPQISADGNYIIVSQIESHGASYYDVRSNDKRTINEEGLAFKREVIMFDANGEEILRAKDYVNVIISNTGKYYGFFSVDYEKNETFYRIFEKNGKEIGVFVLEGLANIMFSYDDKLCILYDAEYLPKSKPRRISIYELGEGTYTKTDGIITANDIVSFVDYGLAGVDKASRKLIVYLKGAPVKSMPKTTYQRPDAELKPVIEIAY